jgi:anaerobic selenocysteine-containing dehydrogenase
MLSDTGFKAGHGLALGRAATEIADHSDLVVVWGCNPVNTHVNLMTHIARARKERGAKLVVVDPLPLRHGGGRGHALGAQARHRRRPGLRRHAPSSSARGLPTATTSPATATGPTSWSATSPPARPSGPRRLPACPVAEIEAFARLWGSTKRAYLRLGYGFTRSRNGAAAMHAASCLPVVTGAWAHPGGGALYNFGDLYRLDKTVIEGLDVLDRSTRLLDQSRIGPILCGDRTDLGDGPPVAALLIQNTNPACVAPDLAQVHRGFARPTCSSASTSSS